MQERIEAILREVAPDLCVVPVAGAGEHFLLFPKGTKVSVISLSGIAEVGAELSKAAAAELIESRVQSAIETYRIGASGG